MPSCRTRRVRDEQVVADELDLAAELVGEQLPAVPVVLGAAVLDRDDRVLVSPARVAGRRTRRACRILHFASRWYLPSLEELGRSDVHAEERRRSPADL